MGKSDTWMFLLFFGFFLIVGALIPYVQQSAGMAQSTFDTGIVDDVGQESVTSGSSVLISMATTVFFWSFGVPWWLNLIFWLPRAFLYLYAWKVIVRGVGS